MKKIISIPVYVLFVLCTMLVVSCSEDSSVTPNEEVPYQFDSARYDYKVTRIPGFWYDTGELWAQDTSEVFIVNPFNQRFVHIVKGLPTNYYDPGFNPATVSGLSNSEVYLGGYLKIGKIIKPGIKKWNGSYLEDFPIDLNFEKTTFINKSLIKSSSDMWLLCNNVIIRKDGSKFLKYTLEDTVSKILDACLDQNGIPTYSQIFLNSDLDSMQTIKIYKFYGKWTKVFEAREEIAIYTYSKFDNKICRRDLHKVFLFNGSDFSKFFNTDLLRLFRIQGFSEQNLMVNSIYNKNGFNIFNWNGKKWSEEYSVIGTGTVIFPINKNLYYFYYENNSEQYTDVVRAYRKE